MTYTELKDAVIRYLQRDDVTDTEFAHWVVLAEIRMKEMLRLQNMHKGINFTVTVADEGKLNTPARFIEFTNVRIDDRHLSQISHEQLQMEMEDVNSRGRVDNKPTYYARMEQIIKIWPYDTDNDMNGKMWYYEFPPALTEANPTNIISTDYGDIYFWRILTEAFHRYGYDERSQLSSARFQEAITAAQNLTKRAEFSGSVQRIRPRQKIYRGY